MAMSDAGREGIPLRMGLFTMKLCQEALEDPENTHKRQKALKATRLILYANGAAGYDQQPKPPETSLQPMHGIAEAPERVSIDFMEIECGNREVTRSVSANEHTPSATQRGVNIAGELGVEVLELIFERIGPSFQLANVARVCKNWCRTAQRLIWTHPKFVYNLDLTRFFKFYAGVTDQRSQSGNKTNTNERMDPARVRKITWALGNRTQDPGDRKYMIAILESLPESLPYLFSFEAAHTPLPGRALESLGRHCPSLTAIDLLEVNSLEPAALSTFLRQAGSRLVRLNLTGCSVFEDAISNRQFYNLSDAFKQLTGLRTLCLARSRIKPKYFLTLFESTRGSPIEVVDLGSTLVDDEVVTRLVANFPRLTTVILSHCPNITDVAAKVLAEGAEDLTALAVTRTSITDSGIMALGRGRGSNLKRLVVNGCTSVSDMSLQVLGGVCPNLEILDIAMCWRITHQGITSLTVGANGLGLPSLLHLNLTGASGTINGSVVMTILKACPNLRTLLLPQHVQGKTHSEVMRRLPIRSGGEKIFYPQTWIRHPPLVVGALGDEDREDREYSIDLL
ncbi:Leucine-rich repeat-containing protein 29 [Thoreauomyces humboldtii]|nr:Leucine-rich repeat-containing protein 29 [Thoreauomyces humboldtii]